MTLRWVQRGTLISFLLVAGTAGVFAQPASDGDVFNALLQGLQIGPPVQGDRLTLYPLRVPAELQAATPYQTLGEAMAQGLVVLTELADRTQNQVGLQFRQWGGGGGGISSQFGGGGIFGQGGGGFGGGGQGRGFARNFLVPEGGAGLGSGMLAGVGGLGNLFGQGAGQFAQTVRLPVFCFEEKRSRGTSPFFEPPVWLAPPSVRRTMLGDLNMATQNAVWRQILERLQTLRVRPPTRALASLYGDNEPGRFARSAVGEVARLAVWDRFTVGLLAVGNGRILGLDLYANAELFQKMSPAVIASYALEVVDAQKPSEIPPSRLVSFVSQLATARALEQPSLGLGRDYILHAPGLIGETLLHNGHVIHLAAFPRR